MIFCLAIGCLSQGGCTPLSVAAFHGRLQIVALLLERGADPNLADHVILHYRDIDSYHYIQLVLMMHSFIRYLSVCFFQNGITPLSRAAQCGRREVVALLLERGANPNLASQVLLLLLLLLLLPIPPEIHSTVVIILIEI